MKKKQEIPSEAKQPVVHCINQQQTIPISCDCITTYVLATLSFFQVLCDELTIVFVETQEIKRLHKVYFEDQTTTDCITFPIDSPGTKPYCFLGEIFVCPETALMATKKYKKTLQEELALYIIHGILHLLGYDDQTDKERALMQTQEQQALDHLKKNNLLY